MRLRITAVFCAIAMVGLISATASEAGEACDPLDQLPCSCADVQSSQVNSTVSACFLGDVNTTSLNQADGASARVFAGINWPVKMVGGKAVAGVPDLAGLPGGDWTTVWDTWKSTNHIFRGDKPPLPWEETDYPVPAACADVDVKAAMAAIPFADQIPHDIQPRLLDEYVNPEGLALVDHQGRPVRYDVIFNKQAYDYVADNDLWQAHKLEAYLAAHDKALNLPMGRFGDTSDGVNKPQKRGAVVLKTAWMVLDANSDPGDFHKNWAYVLNTADGDHLTHQCTLQPVGLVGMHVIYKTEQFPHWAWSTFQQNDVAPYADELERKGDCQTVKAGVAAEDWLFYADACDLPAGPLKQPTSFQIGTPSRISVLREPLQSSGFYNQQLAEGFKGMPFGNYTLMGTQWEDSILDSKTGKFVRAPKPPHLANATLESFSQADSSCQSCHSYAKPDHGDYDRRALDFIFSFNRDVLNRGTPAQIRR